MKPNKPKILSIKNEFGKIDGVAVWVRQHLFFHEDTGENSANGELINVDGVYHYHPLENSTIYNAKELRMIADKLDKLDKLNRRK